MATKREESAIIRHHRKAEDLTRGSKQLHPLITGDHVYIQDQHGKTPKRWNKSGIILEVEPHDSYLVKVNGSGKITKQNKQFSEDLNHSSLNLAHPQLFHQSPQLLSWLLRHLGLHSHSQHPLLQSSHSYLLMFLTSPSTWTTMMPVPTVLPNQWTLSLYLNPPYPNT